METWVHWTLGLIAFELVAKLLVIGFGDFPQIVSRREKSIDCVIATGWLLWGFSVAFK